MDVLRFADLVTASTPGRVRGAIRDGELVRVRRGLYTPGVPATRDLLAALQADLPWVVASHRTAATILGFDDGDAGPLHVTVPHDRPLADRRGLVVHRSRRDVPVRTVEGVRVTDPVPTVLDLARTCTLPDGVAFADAAVHAGLTSPEELVGSLPAVHHLDGAARARRAVRLCRVGAESPMESRVRVLLVEAGLPEPVLQHPVVTVLGRFRLDLAWPALRAALEYDGRRWHTDDVTFARDRHRWRALQAAGWTVHPVTAVDLRHPARLLAEMRRALRP